MLWSLKVQDRHLTQDKHWPHVKQKVNNDTWREILWPVILSSVSIRNESNRRTQSLDNEYIFRP